MPLAIQPPEDTCFCIFVVPGSRALGTSDSDFSNVQTSSFNFVEHKHVESCADKIFFAANGKLGSLAGGLLHIPDVKPAMSAEEVKQKHVELMHRTVESKRTCIRLFTAL